MPEAEARKKVLIVEDELLVAENLRDVLEKHHYNVVDVCASGENALQAVEETPPDVVLMDIRLKGPLDGIETVLLAERVRNHPFSVVFLTAHTQDQFPHLADVKSPYVYLTKPYSSADLLAILGHLLQRH